MFRQFNLNIWACDRKHAKHQYCRLAKADAHEKHLEVSFSVPIRSIFRDNEIIMQQALVSLSLSFSLSLSLTLSLTCFSKSADSLDPEDLRRLAKPNQGQTGITRINLVSERPTLRPMPRKNIISDIGFEPMCMIRWVHSYLKEKQKFKQVRTTNLVFHACSAPFNARVH